jgi:flagellar basal body-associated protein FliL
MSDDTNNSTEASGDSAKAASGGKSIVPLLGGILGGALASFAMCQFVLVPKIQKAASGAHPEASAAQAPDAHGAEKKADAHGGGGGHGGKEDDKNAPKATYTKEGWSYAFPSVTANLSGSLGRQYLKCSFQIVSDDKNIAALVEENKGKLKDVVLSVLGARSLADVESPSAKAVLRAELVANLNKALSTGAIKQVQFTEFLIQ